MEAGAPSLLPRRPRSFAFRRRVHESPVTGGAVHSAAAVPVTAQTCRTEPFREGSVNTDTFGMRKTYYLYHCLDFF